MTSILVIRMKDEGGRWKEINSARCAPFHPSSFILHPQAG
jgi:hypothetical protein